MLGDTSHRPSTPYPGDCYATFPSQSFPFPPVFPAVCWPDQGVEFRWSDAWWHPAVAVPCFHPLPAWRTASGGIVFTDNLARDNIISRLDLPCGRCVGCRLERSRQWAVRCMHESQMHKENCFVTLTYDDEHLPPLASLRYRDFQLFLKRARKRLGKFRYFAGGEYGEQTNRPHYHACLFGIDFPDRLYFKTTGSGEKIYTSELLSLLWPHGHSSIGTLTFESAAYVARYCLKKVNGDGAEFHYNGREPEMGHMSLKPGIGETWFRKYHSDVYPSDQVISRGYPAKPPRYYDKKLKKISQEMLDEVQYMRYSSSRGRSHDETDERLHDREVVTLAKLSHLRREL